MLNLFKWEDSLSTGFEDVDLQHKKLISIIDDVYSCVTGPKESYSLSISKDLKRLTDYTQYHFSEEEALMRRNSFPRYEGHKKEHDGFIARVASQVKALGDGNPDDGYQLYRFLGSWLLAHIAKSDHEWASYISGKNKTGA